MTEFKDYIVYYRTNPNYGSVEGKYRVPAKDKTQARMFARGELVPCKILKIEEEVKNS